MHSLYEIETNVKRSAKSQGLSWGVSEEIGKSIRILEQSGLQGLESFKNIVDFGFDNLTKLLTLTKKQPLIFALFILEFFFKIDLISKKCTKHLNLKTSKSL